LVFGAGTIVVRLGVDEESGCESVDFLLWKENWDFVAAEPFFMAVSDGTRRPRGRFSESKIAIFSGKMRRSWTKVCIDLAQRGGYSGYHRLSAPPFF
jgi:acetylornithine deacetylase/succinyl-diaminopimelate desuccinylase-like protein